MEITHRREKLKPLANTIAAHLSEQSQSRSQIVNNKKVVTDFFGWYYSL